MLVFWQSLWLRHIIRIFEGSRRTRWAGRMIDAIFTFPAGAGIVTEVGVIFLGSGSGGRPIVGRTMVRSWRVRRIGLHFVATLGTLLFFGSSGGGDRRRRRRRRSWRVISSIYRGKSGGGGGGRLGEDVGARRDRLRTGDSATRIAGVTRVVERVIRPVAMSLLLLLLVFLALLR